MFEFIKKIFSKKVIGVGSKIRVNGELLYVDGISIEKGKLFNAIQLSCTPMNNLSPNIIEINSKHKINIKEKNGENYSFKINQLRKTTSTNGGLILNIIGAANKNFEEAYFYN